MKAKKDLKITSLKVFSYSHILTISIGFFKIALTFIIFGTARNSHDIIVYAILIFIYLTIHTNKIQSLLEMNNRLSSANLTDDQESLREGLHGIISYVFTVLIGLICLYYFTVAVLQDSPLFGI